MSLRRTDVRAKVMVFSTRQQVVTSECGWQNRSIVPSHKPSRITTCSASASLQPFGSCRTPRRTKQRLHHWSSFPSHAWPAGACKSLERQRCKPSSDRPSSQGSPPRDAKRCGSSCLAGSTRVFASPWHRMRQPSRFACEFRAGCTEAVSYLAESPDGYMASLKARFQQACRSDIYWVPPA